MIYLNPEIWQGQAQVTKWELSLKAGSIIRFITLRLQMEETRDGSKWRVWSEPVNVVY